MISNSIKEVVRNRWCYKEILPKLDSCCWTIMLYEKVERQSKQWWHLCNILARGEWLTPLATPFIGASGTYSWIIFIYVVLVSLLLFLSVLKNLYWHILRVNITRMTTMTSYLRLYCSFWTYFTHCYGVSIAGWHWTSKYRLGKVFTQDLKH